MALPDYVTIQDPGLQDVIRIPILESEELKRQRIQRYKASKSPVPDILQWIPDWINYLDDAQDLLFVTLAAGKLIAPKVLARMLPILGWALLVNDVLNLATTVLGAVQGSRFPKRDILEFTKNIKRGRAGRVTAASSFVSKKFPWVPFAIQGAQVLYNFTGYGLQLGTLMGAVTDTIWASFRALQGTPVRIIAPPPSDIMSRAGRVASQAWMIPYMAPAATWDDLKLAVIGQAAAHSVLGDYAIHNQNEDQVASFGQMEFPGFAVWNDTSRAALQAEGYSDIDLMLRPHFIREYAPSMESATRRAIAHDPNLDATIGDKAPPTTETGAVQQVFEEAAVSALDVYHETLGSVAPLHTPWERLLSRMWHENVFPPWEIEPCALNIKTALQGDFYMADYVPGRDRRCRNYYYATQVVLSTGQTSPVIITEKWRLPRFYPPLYEDQGWQLLWWLQIALAIRCGKDINGPVFGPAFGASEITVLGTARIGLPRLKTPLRLASVLVWGNAWSRNLDDREIEPKPFEKIPFCITDKRSPYPKLAGIRQDSEILYAVRQLLPAPGTLPEKIEGDFREFGTAFFDGASAPDPTVPL